MTSKLSSTPTAVRLPVELLSRYDNLAKQTGRSRTYYLTEALEASISQLEYEYGILQQVEDWRAGRLETVNLDEVGEMLGLED
ncbi:MAG: antitoxin [Arcanobacterium sp.]|nr:antitoxin [Arcanobacterium sp.]